MHVHESPRRLRHGALAAITIVGVLAAGCAGPGATPTAAPTPIPVASVAAVDTPPPTAKPTPSPAAIVVVTPVPDAPDSGVTDQLESLDAKWSLAELTAPAGKTWHVSIDAKDPLGMHNFTITSGPATEQRIFQSPKFGFGPHTFDLPALPAGTYAFICTLHADTMHGTIVVS